MGDINLKRRPLLLGVGAGLLAASTGAFAQNRGRGRGRGNGNAAATGIALPISGVATPLGPPNAATQEIFGTFSPTEFIVTSAGALVVEGVLRLVNGIVRTIQLPVTNSTSNCTILDLTLGPLDLNLLGLEIHLDQVHLVIEANPLGGLLGQLLCSIANLLGGGLQNVLGAALLNLAGLLNDLLDLFG